MMTPAQFNPTILQPAIAWAKSVPGWFPLFDDRAQVMLLAIAGQESGWTYRQQQGGPAHGFWQFERGGGVHGVMTHPTTKILAHAAVAHCAACHGPSEADAYAALTLPEGDGLALAFARLLLLADPAPLSAVGDISGSWAYYFRNWRPGRPGPGRWPANYAAARGALGI